MGKAKRTAWDEVMEYASSIRDGRKIANKERKQAVSRFFKDLDNPEYEIDHKAPEFCIGIIESTICHQQGEMIDGTPLRGEIAVDGEIILTAEFTSFSFYDTIES